MCKFVGASERLRLEMAATETLASAQRPGRGDVLDRGCAQRARRRSDAARRSVRRSTSASSTCTRCRRRSAACGSSRPATHCREEIARTPLVQQLAERMHIEPLHYNDIEHAARAGARPADRAARLRRQRRERARAARAGRAPGARARRRRAARRAHADLRRAVVVRPRRRAAAAASLARHLPIDVGMLVRDEDEDGSYRDLLDLRDVSLRVHGLDIRTETFRGSATEAVRERLVTSDEQTLLVIGLTRAGALQRPHRRSAAAAARSSRRRPCCSSAAATRPKRRASNAYARSLSERERSDDS